MTQYYADFIKKYSCLVKAVQFYDQGFGADSFPLRHFNTTSGNPRYFTEPLHRVWRIVPHSTTYLKPGGLELKSWEFTYIGTWRIHNVSGSRASFLSAARWNALFVFFPVFNPAGFESMTSSIDKIPRSEHIDQKNSQVPICLRSREMFGVADAWYTICNNS